MITTKHLLSGSTNGIPILVTGTATGSATTIHTAVALPSLDEIWLYGFNVSGTAELLTVEWGGTTDPGQVIQKTMPALGTHPDSLLTVIPGLLLTNGLLVKAFSPTGSVIVLTGYVNRANL
jgi:hypothetical protein